MVTSHLHALAIVTPLIAGSSKPYSLDRWLATATVLGWLALLLWMLRILATTHGKD